MNEKHTETIMKTTEQKEADRIIDAMGGTVAVCKIFNITDGAVSQWRENGIPEARLFSIKLLRPDLFEKAA
jgi:hypothetical protein